MMYTDDKNAQAVLALLKQYGIKKIVVSPGMTNVPISRSVQIDPWFEVYSVVDERSAAYFACGLSYASGEPVVISCTGATASRNYLPGLTEAYYRNLPIIALTSQRHTSDYGNLVPQITDRTSSQNDIKKISVHLPVVRDDEDFERCTISVNRALIAATTRGGGPVHINLPVDNFSFTTEKLPEVRKITYYDSDSIKSESAALAAELSGKRVAIFIGAHAKFDKSLKKAVESFATKFGGAVIVDQTSNYTGKNAILLAQIADLKNSSIRPDVVIDIGSITGEYSIGWLFNIETWRISEDGEIHDRMHRQTKLFDCIEEVFFSALAQKTETVKIDYYKELEDEVASISIPELPFSNTYVSHLLSRHLPKNSSLHMGILNSLRNMNFFALDDTIDGSSNVGGFGIDGALSTLIGQSMFDKKHLVFGLVGDLAAFYDMNALGIRHIGNNVRILIVNNGGGVEFRLNDEVEKQLGEDTNEFIAAAGHNGSMKAWAEARGFYYMTASDKGTFSKQINDFCSPDLNKFKSPVVFEVFTTMESEQSSLREMHASNRVDNSPEELYGEDSEVEYEPVVSRKAKIKAAIKNVTPESAKKIYRKIRNRD